MPVGLGFLRRGHLLAGEVCTIRLSITAPFGRELDEQLWHNIQEVRIEFEPQIKEKVATYLGPEFQVLRIGVTRGSVDVWIVIGVVGAAYMTIARYKSFRESLQYLMADLRMLAEQVVDYPRRPDLYISPSWSPGPALLPLEEEIKFPGRVDSMYQLLLWYLILSHAALLLVFLWLVVQGAR